MGTITVKCPKCREVMEIDGKTGKILKHHVEIEPKSATDFLNERLQSLKGEKARLEEMVADSREREKGRSGEHEKLFEKVREKAKGPPVERDLRDIDID